MRVITTVRLKFFCTYYKTPSHTEDRCYKLHGRPPHDQRGMNQGKRFAGNIQGDQYEGSVGNTSGMQGFDTNPGNVCTNAEHPPTLTPKLYNLLLALLGKSSGDPGPSSFPASADVGSSSAFLAGTGICLFSSALNHQWILDSGATDHISPHLHFFFSYRPVSKPCYITLPNGDKTLVKHIGTVHLTNDLQLHDVLHVPTFSFNLISVSKLTKSHNTNLTLTHSHGLIQGTSMR